MLILFHAGTAGLETVAYRLRASNGTLLTEWTTDGVAETEVGKSGIYFATVSPASNLVGSGTVVEWRTADGGTYEVEGPWDNLDAG